MNGLTVLPPITLKPRPAYDVLYSNAFFRAWAAYLDAPDDETRAKAVPKAALYGVRMLRYMDMAEPQDETEAIEQFELYQGVMNFMGLLTPRQLMRVFPVPKEYDGRRHGWKDYFSVMEATKAYDPDRPVGGKITGFLWGILNAEIGHFLAEMLCLVSRIRCFQGHKGLVEEFFNIPVYHEHTDPVTGQTYLQNSETGEVSPAKKPRPRYLRLLDAEE